MFEKRVHKLINRLGEIETLLGDPDLFNDQKKYRTLTQEHAQLNELKHVWDLLQKVQKEAADNEELLKLEGESEFALVLKEDIEKLLARKEKLQVQLEQLLVPPDPNDSRPIIIELRAGTGGDEAALFVGDCVRMYKMFSDKMGWGYEQLSAAESDMGGDKRICNGHLRNKCVPLHAL